MKKLIFFSICGLLLLSCEKDDLTLITRESIIGTWLLERAVYFSYDNINECYDSIVLINYEDFEIGTTDTVSIFLHNSEYYEIKVLIGFIEPDTLWRMHCAIGYCNEYSPRDIYQIIDFNKNSHMTMVKKENSLLVEKFYYFK